MPQTKDTLVLLRKLSDLDTALRRLPADAPSLAAITLEIEDMRERLPTSLLSHYDMRRSRGKPVIAAVRGNVCGGCHLSLPSGLAAALRRGGEIHALHVCTHCGVFLFQDATPVDAAPAGDAPAADAPVKRRRKPSATKKV